MNSPDSVEVTRFVMATPQTVFSIITTPEGFSAWMDGEADFEAVEGRPYSIRFPRFGAAIGGTVVEVVPNRRLVLTWGMAEGPQSDSFPAGSSTVRVELEGTEDGTQVTLSQSGLPSAEEAPQHEAGWRFHLSRLQLAANRAQLAESLDAALAAWAAAWSANSEDRLGQLQSCCRADVHYADDYATLDGCTLLAAHIAGTLQHVGYASLRTTGPAQVCRGEVLVPWVGEREDGSTALSGTLHAHVGLDGRLQRVTNFWSHVELA